MKLGWRIALAYGLLAMALLGCIFLLRLAPPLWGWARELVGAAIALVAVGVGLKLAQRPAAPPALKPAPDPASPPDSSPDLSPDASPATEPRQDAAARAPQPAAAMALTLTAREHEVLRLLCQGASNKDMARALHLSENTVKTHLASLYAKLQVSRRTEAQALAYRLGLVTPKPESS